LVRRPRPAGGAVPAWHLYVVRSEQADALSDALTAEGVGNRAYYRVPLHQQPALREFGEGVELPVTDVAARTHLALPMSPSLTADQVHVVCDVIRGKLSRLAA
ncbi:MAG TPA: DegT/DnrJ/EryC1/StrS family aminotransferase, partial [Solirubrobacteraceae bacterium]|nr:DegT/DnrJ/EryC1/StrS family aminotransferase [Solirubrobacteraceae bacterium]